LVFINFNFKAFTCIGTEPLKFPQNMASEIAISTVSNWLQNQDNYEKVLFIKLIKLIFKD